MNKIKCITFDKKAQEALPEHIKAKMRANMDKSKLADTINTISVHDNLSAKECERYGMTWGCDGKCPVFSKGKCKMEDIEAFRKQITTTDRFDNFTYEELNKLYPKLNLID